MAELVTLSEDGPLGRAGDQVWVDDPSQAATPAGWVDPNPPKGSKKQQQPAAPPAAAAPPDPPVTTDSAATPLA